MALPDFTTQDPATYKANIDSTAADHESRLAHVVLDVDNSAVEVVNTTTLTSVYSFIIPANTLTLNSKAKLILNGDVLINAGSSSLIVKCTFGSTVIVSEGSIANSGTVSASGIRRSVKLEIDIDIVSSSLQNCLTTAAIGDPLADGSWSTLSNPLDGDIGISRYQGIAESLTTPTTVDVSFRHSVANANISFFKRSTLFEILG